ncbi:MAG: purine-nucleoside phosphorylase [Eubacteriales bacterium]|nr:purine-nucleoside phosphorylase [Eubacteriales bacterium]
MENCEKYFDITPDYEYCEQSVNYLLEKISERPKIGIILGTGLGPLANELEVEYEVPYSEIPNFPISTNASHEGKLIFGKLCGIPVVCMKGRFHYYEGYSFEALAFPVRTFKLLGVEMLIVTNAAGGVNLSYEPGDIMLIHDHINLCGYNPNIGQSYKPFGERFYDASNIYNKKMLEVAVEKAKESGLTVHKGVYMFFAGPNFETPAEIRAARILGADAVGMSTVPEALTASQCKMPVLGFSVITNMAAGVRNEILDDCDVNAVASKIETKLSAYVKSVIEALVKLGK